MTFAQYAALKNKLIYPELYDTLKTGNQTMAVWDLGTSDSPSIQVNRLNDYGTVSEVDCTTSISATDIGISAANFEFQTFQETLPLCYDVKTGANAGGSAEQALLMAGMRAASEKFEDLIIDGSASGKFKGLDQLVEISFAKAGASLALGDLSKAIRLNKGVGPKAFVTDGATYDKIEGVLQSNSTLGYQDLFGGAFNTISYRNIPVLVNDAVTAGEIYLATLGGADGVSVVLNESSDRKIGGIFGVQQIGPQLTSINEYVRFIWRATQVLGNPQALVKITGA